MLKPNKFFALTQVFDDDKESNNRQAQNIFSPLHYDCKTDESKNNFAFGITSSGNVTPGNVGLGSIGNIRSRNFASLRSGLGMTGSGFDEFSQTNSVGTDRKMIEAKNAQEKQDNLRRQLFLENFKG